MRRIQLSLAVIASLLLAGCGNSPSPPPLSGYTVVRAVGMELVPQSLAFAGAMNSGTVTANCPGSEVAIGGGFKTGDEAGNTFVSGPTPSGNGWSVSTKNENVLPPLVGNTVNVTVFPFAVCVNRPAGYQIVKGSTNVQTQSVSTAEARCPDATFRGTGGGVVTGDQAVQWFSSAAGNGAQPSWSARFKNHTIVVPSNYLVESGIVCGSVSAIPDITVVTSTPATVASGAQSTLTLNCPANTKVLSGGVASGGQDTRWIDDAPAMDGSGWSATLKNNNSTTLGPVLTIFCAAAGP